MRFQLKKAETLLALGTTLLCLLLLELGARVAVHLENRGVLEIALAREVEIPADGLVELGHAVRLSTQDRIVYELKPDLEVVLDGTPLTTDSHGFRTHGPELAAVAGSRHIVGLGDSFMFGAGVEDGQTYLAVLQGLLEERRPDLGYRIVNTGVPGYNTVMEVETLKTKGLDFAPEIVVIEFVGNDLSLPNFIRSVKPVWTLRRSYFADFVRQRLGHFRDKKLWRRLQLAGLENVDQDDTSGLGNQTDPDLVPERYRDLVGWESYTRAMTELRDLAELHDFEVVSISLAPGNNPVEASALELSQNLGFHVLDVGETYRAYLEVNPAPDFLHSPLALSPDDGHPSVLGHQLAGEVLFDFLLEEGILRTAEADSGL